MPELGVHKLGNRPIALRVRDLVADQEGVVSRKQLLDRGIGPAPIVRARESKRLFDLHPDYGVYSVMPPELLSEDGRLIGALLAVGRSAYLASQTAAWRQNLIVVPPMMIELITRDHHLSPEGVVVRRSPGLRTDDVIDDDRFPITTVTRTLLDLAVGYRPWALGRALAQAEFEHNVRPQDVLAVLRRGHPGSANLRRALELHVPGFGKARSTLEKRFRELLITAGIPLPERNEKVGQWTVDCLWREAKVVVELDGGQHVRPHQAKVDADRDLWLRRDGCIIRRYTWDQVTNRGEQVIADLLEALSRTNPE